MTLSDPLSDPLSDSFDSSAPEGQSRDRAARARSLRASTEATAAFSTAVSVSAGPPLRFVDTESDRSQNPHITSDMRGSDPGSRPPSHSESSASVTLLLLSLAVAVAVCDPSDRSAQNDGRLHVLQKQKKPWDEASCIRILIMLQEPAPARQQQRVSSNFTNIVLST